LKYAVTVTKAKYTSGNRVCKKRGEKKKGSFFEGSEEGALFRFRGGKKFRQKGQEGEISFAPGNGKKGSLRGGDLAARHDGGREKGVTFHSESLQKGSLNLQWQGGCPFPGKDLI